MSYYLIVLSLLTVHFIIAYRIARRFFTRWYKKDSYIRDEPHLPMVGALLMGLFWPITIPIDAIGRHLLKLWVNHD